MPRGHDKAPHTRRADRAHPPYYSRTDLDHAALVCHRPVSRGEPPVVRARSRAAPSCRGSPWRCRYIFCGRVVRLPARHPRETSATSKWAAARRPSRKLKTDPAKSPRAARRRGGAHLGGVRVASSISARSAPRARGASPAAPACGCPPCPTASAVSSARLPRPRSRSRATDAAPWEERRGFARCGCAARVFWRKR